MLFVPVQRGNLRHFLVRQLKAEQVKIFPDVIRQDSLTAHSIRESKGQLIRLRGLQADSLFDYFQHLPLLICYGCGYQFHSQRKVGQHIDTCMGPHYAG